MSTTELKALLDQVADTRELVLRRAASLGPAFNAVYDAWSDAHEEAEGALHARGARAAAATTTPSTAPPRTARTPRRTRSQPPARAERDAAGGQLPPDAAAQPASLRMSCASASGVSWSCGKPTRWRPCASTSTTVGGVVELAAPAAATP